MYTRIFSVAGVITLSAGCIVARLAAAPVQKPHAGMDGYSVLHLVYESAKLNNRMHPTPQ